jgi:hypothetical protein
MVAVCAEMVAVCAEMVAVCAEIRNNTSATIDMWGTSLSAERLPVCSIYLVLGIDALLL